MSFLSPQELAAVGFESVGENVLISRKASIYGASRISISRNVRIDDFVVLSAGEGGISIGKHVHIAIMASMIGAGRIEMGDYSTLSGKVSIYSSSDDFSGSAMTNPTVPSEFTNVTNLPVTIGRHVIVGSGSVILPGAHVGNGSAVGAMSLVKGKLEEGGIYSGIPAVRVRDRATDIYALEEKLNDRVSQS